MTLGEVLLVTVCMWCPFSEYCGLYWFCSPKWLPNLVPSLPGSSPTRGPSRRGPWERGWWLPPDVLTSQCLVTSFISVLRRSAWWEIMGLLDVHLVTFILSQRHFERYVKEQSRTTKKKTNKQNPRVSISLLSERIRNMRREINCRKEVASSLLPRMLLPSYRTLEQALACATGTMKMKGAR